MKPCENWELYKQTVFKYPEDFVLSKKFGLVSHENPLGKDGHIDEPTEKLSKNQRAKILGHLVGCSPDFQHQEHSIAFSLSKEDVIQIGVLWSQDAIFYIQNGKLLLVHCESYQEECLGEFTDRLIRN
jgi:hypothetical protein